MTDNTSTQMAASPPRSGGKINDLIRGVVGSFVASGLSYFLTQLSMRGVDFKGLGLDSEVNKALIVGAITGLIVAPRNLILLLRDGGIFLHWSVKTLWFAIVYGKEQDT